MNITLIFLMIIAVAIPLVAHNYDLQSNNELTKLTINDVKYYYEVNDLPDDMISCEEKFYADGGHWMFYVTSGNKTHWMYSPVGWVGSGTNTEIDDYRLKLINTVVEIFDCKNHVITYYDIIGYDERDD